MFRFEAAKQFKKAERQLDWLARREVPFAIAVSLTQVAVRSRDVLRNVEERQFTLRSRWVQRGTQARAATKRTLRSEVGSVDWFMEQQDTGGIRKPKKSRHIAEPKKIRSNKKRRITPAKRPRRVLAKPNVFRAKSRRGNEVILQRPRGKAKPKLLYVLHKRIRIKRKAWFESPVERTARRELPEIFGRNLAKGIAQARRKA